MAMRDLVVAMQGSCIREVADAGLKNPDVLAFWFGESDEVTPLPVREAAMRSLERGETFYGHNLGLPELREALARTMSGLHRPVSAERIAVTSSGVSALMLATELLAGAGDEVVAVVPVWPNLTQQPAVMGARVRRAALAPDAAGVWRLDVRALTEAVTAQTKVLLVNSPNNPTGWTLTRDEQQALLAHCRRTGTWIVADEVYERMWFGVGGCAPSFLDLATPDDRLIVVHSFSKSFLMTGWRLGWMVLPDGVATQIGKLIEFNTSCAPEFVQRGGLAALALGDSFVEGLVQRLRTCRDLLLTQLRQLPGVTVAVPDGGLYVFLRVEAQADSLALAKRLVAEHGLGLAPGIAFGPEGEGWLRWCFASRDPARLTEGVARLARALGL
ncbi:MAG TPA: pyridoxal phosphate-dependent aminotransferase [Burkholderiaceae bacterium]|nr:pyridoxal phosphate-dependent aminotransferase [Burkholderiaceae bacterium]